MCMLILFAFIVGNSCKTCLDFGSDRKHGFMVVWNSSISVLAGKYMYY